MAEPSRITTSNRRNNSIPSNQMWLNPLEAQQHSIPKMNNPRAVKAVADHAESKDENIFSQKGAAVGAKEPTKPEALSVLKRPLMSLFNTTMSDDVAFGEVVSVLDGIPDLDYDANLINNTALGIYYETSKRVQFRLGLFLNEEKQTFLDCRRLKGDSFVMNSFFTILTTALSKKPELGVKVVLDDDEYVDFFDDDEEDLELEGHLSLKRDPKLVLHLMEKIESSDAETKVNDLGLLAFAAELNENVETLAAEGGASLVKLLEGKLQHDNAALARQSAVLLKELTRMHPEIFTPSTARTMVTAMGRWAPKSTVKTDDSTAELVSSRTTVTNLAQGMFSLMNSKHNLVKPVQLDEDSIQGIIDTLQKYPSTATNAVATWVSQEVAVC